MMKEITLPLFHISKKNILFILFEIFHSGVDENKRRKINSNDFFFVSCTVIIIHKISFSRSSS